MHLNLKHLQVQVLMHLESTVPTNTGINALGTTVSTSTGINAFGTTVPTNTGINTLGTTGIYKYRY